MKIGFATGCFDRFHKGHAHFLLSCRERCDYLVVAVNHDRWCRRKGVTRPFDYLATRMTHVCQTLHRRGSLPSYAVVPFSGNDLALAAEIHPDVIFRGYDQREDSGLIPVIRIGHLEGFSTTLAAQSRSPE